MKRLTALLAALLLLLALVGCAPESSYPEDSYLIRGTVYLKDQLATPIICIYRDEEYGGGLAAISVDNLDDFEIGDRVEARVGGRIMEMSPGGRPHHGDEPVLIPILLLLPGHRLTPLPA